MNLINDIFCLWTDNGKLSRKISRRRLARGVVRFAFRVEGQVAVSVHSRSQNDSARAAYFQQLKDVVASTWGPPDEDAVVMDQIDARIVGTLELDMARGGVDWLELACWIYRK